MDDFSMQMQPSSTAQLIDRWQRVLSQQGDKPAVWEWSEGSQMPEVVRFTDLDAAAERKVRKLLEGGGDGPDLAPVVVVAAGSVAAVVTDVLAAWKAGRAAVLEEAGEAPPLPGRPWPGSLPVALVKRTSGSTGRARHLLFSAGQLAADVDQLMPSMALDPAWINLAAVSPAHSYGFSNLVTPLLLHGMRLVAPGSVLPQALRRAQEWLASAGGPAAPLVIPAVPAMWRAWLQAGAVDPALVARAISAGAPLPSALERKALKTSGLKIHNFYGSSECGGIAYDDGEELRSEPGMVGRPVAGVTLEIDSDGRVVVHSRACALGVWKPSGNVAREVVGDGRFVSTDLGRIGDDGGLRLVGRADDVVNLAGRKVNPEAIEAVLRTHDLVEHCVVFGIDSGDAARGHELVACVRLRDGGGALAGDSHGDSLRRWLAERLPSWQRPRHWWVCKDLAPDVRGKIPREGWRRRYLEARSGDQTGWT